MLKRIFQKFSLALAFIVASGCAISGNNDGVPVKVNNVSGSTQTFAISGSVLSGTASRLLRAHRFSQSRILAQSSTNSCANASCSTSVVGTGITGPSCSVSNGTFTISSVPAGEQLEAKFNCGGSSQSCILMSGDNGVTCDPVADGILQAFLATTSKSSLADSSFRNANIVQIAHSIEQATLNSSTSSTSLINAVSSCASSADQKACNLNAIKNSAFAGPLTLMKTMVNGWDASAIFTFLTDTLGYELSVDTLTYTDFGTRLDSWLNTDFIAKTRAAISAALVDQGSGGNGYAFKIVCKMRYSRYQGSGNINYTPPTKMIVSNGTNITVPTCVDPNDGTGPLSLNGFTSSQISTINTAINSSSGSDINISSNPGAHPCSESNSYNDSQYFCVSVPEITIMTKATEVNRNDPLGSNNNNFINTQKISLIDVFPAIQNLLANPTPADPHTTGTGSGGTACLSNLGNGAPQVVNDGNGPCNTWFGNLVTSHSSYFAGAAGIYMALANNAFGTNNKISLNNIYSIFSGSGFLGERLTLPNSASYNISLNSIFYNTSGDHGWLYPLLKYVSDSSYSLDSIFLQGSDTTVTPSQAESYYNAAPITYANSLKTFETIPSATTIHDLIFKSSYHVDYNPTGQAKYYALSNANSGSSDPIFCKMTDASTAHVPIEVDMASQPSNIVISCAASSSLSGVSVDANGNITVPTSFSYPYILTRYGFQGDSLGGIFALADWKTGFWAEPNGNQQFIYQENPNNPVCKTAAEYNHVVQANMALSNGSTTYQQLITAYCMDLSSFTATNAEQFYYGGNVTISDSTATCPGCSIGGFLIGGYNSNDVSSFSTPPVCAWTSYLSTDSYGVTTATGSVAINGSGQITSLGDIVVDYCTASHSGTQYNLISISQFGSATTPSSIYAQLVASSSGTPTVGANPLQYSSSQNSWITIDGASLNTAFVSALGAGYRVAPLSAPNNFLDIQLANTEWETKFDPYCDAGAESDHLCHCYDSTTNAEKSGSSCTLEDTPKDGTISQKPYYVSSGSSTPFDNFFTNFGGMDLSSFTCGSVGTGCNTPGASLGYGNFPSFLANGNIDWEFAVRCKYLVGSEKIYRHPTNLGPNWGDGAQQGCPASAGGAAANGPVTLIYPVAMNNAYAVLEPNVAAKVANYITRDTGQGVSIDPNEKLFTFDTALALIAFRNLIPLTNLTVSTSSGTITNSIGLFQPAADPSLNTTNNGKSLTDPVSQVLCFMKNGGQACQ